MSNTTPTPSGIEALVCADIAQRQARGIEKYGTTVAENPLELVAWLQHAYEEALDQAMYLRRAIDEIQRRTKPVTQEQLAELIAGGLHGTYHCMRAWSAWHHGTMSEDDFEPVAESETPHELAAEIMKLVRSTSPEGNTSK